MSEDLKNDGGASDPVSRINQQFIADQLGVSRTTVSRCFTNHAGTNPVTRARVFDLASQLGYRHMEMRVQRKARTTDMVVGALVCTELEQYFHSDYESPGIGLYAGLSEFALLNKIKLDLFYVNPADSSLDGPSYSRLGPLQKRGWDGVILIYPFPRNIVEAIDMKFPMVSMVEQYGEGAINCVDVDHYKGIAMMIDRLRGLGHERIGFYTKQYAVEAGWSFRRFGAFVEKLARHGTIPSPGDIVNVHPGCLYPTREESFRHIIDRTRDGVTAWVCAADHQAYDLMGALQKAGIRVPEDVSVTGFDGIKKPDWAPLLTTAEIPYWEIGYTSGRRLFDMMKKRFGSPQHVLVEPRMRDGATIGRAQSSS